MRVFRFLFNMFLPPADKEWIKSRLEVRADLHWQPWLFTATFYGALLTLLLGGVALVPPGVDVGGFEWVWLLAAFTCPPVAFAAAWFVRHGKGRVRYIAMWVRLAADIGVLTSLTTFLVERIFFGVGHPFEYAIFTACCLFLAVICARDVKLLILTERLADRLLREDLCRATA